MDKRDEMNEAVADFVIRTVNALEPKNVSVQVIESLTALIKAVNYAPTTVTLETTAPKKRWPGIIPKQF